MRYAVIVAAGESVRYGKDKLDEQIFGKSVLQHSIDVFKTLADVVVVVGRKAEGTLYTKGGKSRFRSVCNGLDALPKDAQGVVAVHDGARPFVTRRFAEKLFEEAEKHGSAVPRLCVTDTLYRRSSKKDLLADRKEFFTVQTPQVFDISKLRKAVLHADADYTDESSLFADIFGQVNFIEGQRNNIKLTYPDDLPDFRVGAGYDVHPFDDGDGVILGGVKIPFEKKLKGHSDADALCHAICDAILSASGLRDIGHQFPDTDPTFEGIDSTLLLRRCVEMANAEGFEVVNASATVICQAPRIAPYAAEMERRLALILKVAPSCVNISATTTEHLGALGNGDGIAVQATALLRKF